MSLNLNLTLRNLSRTSKPNDLINSLALYDFNFATGQIKGAQWSDAVVSRALTAYALNSSGAYESFGSNVLRRTNLGVTIEESRTNLFSNSAAPATQTITVVNGTTYTVSCFVSGSATLSGAGTGVVTPGNPITFVASSTSLTVTISGSPFCVNVSAASTASTPIVGSGATTTRPVDVVYWPVSGIGTEYTLYAETAFYENAARTRTFAQLWNTNETNALRAWLVSGVIGSRVASPTTGARNLGSVSVSLAPKLAIRCKSADLRICANGTLGTVDTGTVPLEPNRIYIGSRGISADYFNEVIKRVAILPVLTDAQMQQITL